MPELDTYDPEVLDDQDYDNLSVGGRLEAEVEMRLRDQAEGRAQGRARKGLLYGKLII